MTTFSVTRVTITVVGPSLVSDVHVFIYLVGGEKRGDVGPVLAQLGIPGGQVLVGHLAGGVKHQYAGVGLVVVASVLQLSR